MPDRSRASFDLEKAAAERRLLRRDAGTLASDAGVASRELSTHLQGQLVAVHPAYDPLFDGFAAPDVRGNPAARTEWAVAADEASRRRPRSGSG